MNSENGRQETPQRILHKRPPDEGNPVSTDPKRRKHDCETRDAGSSQPGLTAEDYTVGWICALPIEMAAAKCMLDDLHDCLERSPNDSNTYVFGTAHRHNVVMACLPTNGYGTNNAATVASDMRRSFPSIRIFLMVGIGGGAPEKADIRLGDVVVSTSVVQYDLGKTIQQGRFQATGIPRQPLPELMTAVSALRAHHELKCSEIPVILSRMQERYPSMVQYTDRGQLQDLLFDSAYDHAESTSTCYEPATCDNCDQSKLVPRPPRPSHTPAIHYGIIASGNQVIKHAETRNQLARKSGAICFEMEAAGIMNSCQCLVIRGICDYSDSHKSKEWQKYASATAAAYAKELLSIIPSAGTRTSPSSRSPSLQIFQGSTHVFLVEIVQTRRKAMMESLSFERIDARHSNIKSAYGKTCAWLLCHPDYIQWLTPAEFPRHHGFLWIYGKPGAGKSTLMKYIYTQALGNTDTTISFFFNARGDGLEKSTEGMYRSLLFQLLEKLPDLQEVLDLTGHFSQCHNDHGSWQIDVLQRLFSAAITRLGRRRVTCFIDALDECSESQIRDMVEYFEQLGVDALEAEQKLYICFSSRHYPGICTKNSQTLTLENQVGHSQDLEKYIRNKLQAGKGKDVEPIRTTLLEKAAGVFLWVVLVVNILNDEFRGGRIFAVKKRLQEIPAGLSELFKDILRRDNKNMADLLLCIQWILYAKRPLRPEEFYYAVVAGLYPDSEDLAEWDPQHISKDDMNRFVLSSSKGLAEVTRSRVGTIQFIHESVRDFLLKDGGIRNLWPDLEAGFQGWSHNRLKECCCVYLKMDISRYVSFQQQLPKANSNEGKALRQQASEKFPFLEYATHQVLYHADAAAAAVEVPQHDFLRTFDLGAWLNLANLFEKFEIRRHTPHASLPYILAENNWARLIKSMFRYNSRVHIHGERHEYPLFAALANGHDEAVAALLQMDNKHGEDAIMTQPRRRWDFVTLKGQTPLLWAVLNGYSEVAQLLLDKGADTESKDKDGQTPLFWAARNGHKEVAQLLFDKGADIESKDKNGQTPLFWAARNGHKEVAQLLLNKGADTESKDKNGQTPLFWAARNGHKEVAQLLLNKGADIESKDKNGQTPLFWATENGYKEVIQLLLDKNANFELKDNIRSQTPLSWAAGNGQKDLVQLLLDKNANLELKNKYGQTPLFLAARNGYKEIVQILLDKNADLEAKDNDGQTPLFPAARNGYKEIVQILLDKGADLESKDNKYGQTPLFPAARNGYKEIVQILLDKGADPEAKDNKYGQTPLFLAARNGYKKIVQILLDKGADPEAKDNDGQTPLSWAARNGLKEVVQILLDKGAELELRNKLL
ncbi:putative NACHT and Ankyrin domain protein [Rosellinia necatrix]|uniref:Putative NACHT and Ankyrin domain protein n=1 Tax=Rosellinia necatrix TaxID=77044 RepID=A0A1S7UK06_ROSNE|nr:putative NACHT and Ankyrin domain protein [Rosellinia necatrix]